MSKKFSYEFKVYYEDTDAGGVVYYANYLKYLERARTEAILSLGYSNTELKNKFNIIFVVKSCNINYLKPLKFENKLIVFSSLNELKKLSFIMDQVIENKGVIVTKSKVHIVCVDTKGKPKKIPYELFKLLEKCI